MTPSALGQVRPERWVLQMRKHCYWMVVGLVLVPAVALIFAGKMMAQTSSPGPDCQDVVVAIVNTTVRRTGGVPTDCFETFSPVGTLEVDVTVTDVAGTEARIDFYGKSRRVEALASSMVVEVHEGEWLTYCVTAPGSEVLPDYKLRLAHGVPAVQKGGDPTEEEIDPDPLRSSLCDAGEVDDHGNVLGCSSPTRLDGWVSGQLLNDWGDDEDFFVFYIEAGLRPTVEMVLSAKGLRPSVELYDRLGYRLADNTGGRLVKTLVGPAWYYVRIWGGEDHAVGPYRLMLDVLRSR